ncbi:hypothetical protein JTE90_011215 [Oedothorax gibbosus]|uniref:Uncharacterized protein n=1 Tax=Oedothorax gibbosus TaxID=931172 RepID=A0AAV6VY02_9ARAC|nr:hypothetical protein JTE90_011215 [Oedothorax gibbosus]
MAGTQRQELRDGGYAAAGTQRWRVRSGWDSERAGRIEREIPHPPRSILPSNTLPFSLKISAECFGNFPHFNNRFVRGTRYKQAATVCPICDSGRVSRTKILNECTGFLNSLYLVYLAVQSSIPALAKTFRITLQGGGSSIEQFVL